MFLVQLLTAQQFQDGVNRPKMNNIETDTRTYTCSTCTCTYTIITLRNTQWH